MRKRKPKPEQAARQAMAAWLAAGRAEQERFARSAAMNQARVETFGAGRARPRPPTEDPPTESTEP